MEKTLSFLLALLAICCTAGAQENQETAQSFIVTGAVGRSEFSTAIAYQHVWKFFKKRKLGIGTGARITSYFGYNRYFKTAPARLISGRTDPLAFFTEDIEENIDSVLFKSTQVNTLNLTINFTYDFSKAFSVGLNLDAIGVTVGGKRSGTYFANDGSTQTIQARPGTVNLLLVSDNDIGSLNSEFFAKYKWNQKWAVRAGLQFLFAEYTTDTKVQTTPDGQKNDRFRHKSAAFLFGVAYQL